MRLSAWLKNVFTLHRWALNPFQMYAVMFLLAGSIAQIQLGVTPASVLTELPRVTIIYLAVANVIGGCIALIGLHLRELEEALWVEFCGYMILIFVLGTYISLVVTGQANPNAGYGFVLTEAFVYAATHRSVQILLYKRARRKSSNLARRADALTQALEGIQPSRPVLGEEDEK